ncbi:hypothetical protein IIA79_01290 [bacterium]|nr:hypothetical protein [bacterium]
MLGVFLLLSAAMGGCGGGSDSLGGAQFTGQDTTGGQSPGEIVANEHGFTLKVLDASYQYGGEAEYSLDVRELAGEASVAVLADAQGLKISYIELSYDDNEVHPVDSRAGEWPGLGQELINLAVLTEPGAIYFGALMANPQDSAGVSGEFTLVTVTFAAGAAALKSASTAPDSAGSVVPDLLVNQSTGDVTFSYYNQGDYDQNSEVNIADLTPLGANFGAVGPFDPSTALSVVDGDSNGELNIADLTPIGANFFNNVTTWHLYVGTGAEYPGGVTPVGNIPFANATGDIATGRLTYAENIPDVMGAGGEGAWLKPVDTDSNEGIASSFYDFTAGDTTPPDWIFAPEGTGVVQVIPRDGAAKVLWGDAVDLQTPPVTYIIYVSEGGTVDFGNPLQMVEVPDPGPGDPEGDGPAELATVITGLTNDMQYSFAVHAKDSATTPNEDDNTVQVSTTPKVTQELPANFSESATFEGPMILSDGSTSSVDCTDGEVILTFLSDLVIDGTLMVGNCDVSLFVEGDLTVSGMIWQDLLDDPLPPEANGNTPSLKIVAKGNVDFTESSVVNGEGNIYIVDDESELIPPEDAVNDIENGDQTEFDFNFDPVPEGGGGSVSSVVFGGASSAAKQASRDWYWDPDGRWHNWRVRGNWGQVPNPPPGTNRIVLRIRSRNGRLNFTNWTITGPDGAKGADAGGCNPIAEDGKDNPWRMRLHAGRLRFNNVTINFGDGGAGGDATTGIDCCPAGIAFAGDGGKPNNKFRISASRSFRIDSLTLNPGSGGPGGFALAFGKNGDPGCPGQDGCDAQATGGIGGDCPSWGVRAWGVIQGLGNLSLGPCKGGPGGRADAFAGNGGAGDPCCSGGNGGVANAVGGDGGDAEAGGAPGGVTAPAAIGGDGGFGNASGGLGGNGGDCWKAQAGDGGDGGAADADGGIGGLATGGSSATDGSDGPGDAFGGDGGDGGKGFPPGVHGIGGLATATGNPANPVDGLDGADGVEWPPGGVWVLCIPFDGFLPPDEGPIPENWSVPAAPVLDAATLEQVGTVPVHFFGFPDTAFWNLDPDLNMPIINFFNPDPLGRVTGVNIELVAMSLSGPDPINPSFDGAEILVRQAQSISDPVGDIGHQQFVDPETGNPFASALITPVEFVPFGDPELQQFFTVESFFDVFYQIEVETESFCEIVDPIYIYDP